LDDFLNLEWLINYATFNGRLVRVIGWLLMVSLTIEIISVFDPPQDPFFRNPKRAGSSNLMAYANSKRSNAIAPKYFIR
jgi:hypothetical protein